MLSHTNLCRFAFSLAHSRCTSLCSLTGILLLWGTGFTSAQANPPAPENQALRATLKEVTQLRDAEIARARTAGFQCTLAVPKIVVRHIPSFGNYDEKNNVLYASDWSLLNPAEKQMFVHIREANASKASAEAVFDDIAHHWIFSHEIGHWLQACQGITVASTPPYSVEYGANRLALAYWREVDPGVALRIVFIFHTVMNERPSPVPTGQDVETYFNQNYEKLGPSPAYPWFQTRMVVSASEEKPAPSFAATLPAKK